MYKHTRIILFLTALSIMLTGWINAKQQTILYTEKKLSQIEKKHGTKVSDRFIKWKQFVAENQDKSESEKLKLTNDFFNRQLIWIEDKKLWKKKDYWATPMETLIKRAGDCEDFTIIKYFTLISLGVPVSHLKLTYVKALKYNQAHMVLTYSETKRSVPLVLDNINKKILPANKRKDLKPVYSFNGEGMWLQKQKQLGKKVGSSSRIRLWVDLNKRMRKELI
ncbi:MAG: transglutaminase-like cysteine peptidase [gamma proteobacterium symbiont of Taylorina sp.]|nr:transglutaminase-like cysteine peptidase [gamma proteobacterium symbiont of Taylorina sp.]